MPREDRRGLGTGSFDERVVTGEKPHHPPYWYFITTTECVLCGAGETTKERRYTPKPKDPYKRHAYEQYACGHHFL